MSSSQTIESRARIGNALIRFSGIVLVFSSLVKFTHGDKPTAYMSFLGYDDGKMFLIAGVEMLIVLLFLRRATRPAGLLLVSSYLGGAIAAHVASHPLNGSAPIVVFNFHHPYLGALPAVVVLLSAWIGAYLSHAESLRSATMESATQAARTIGTTAIKTAA